MTANTPCGSVSQTFRFDPLSNGNCPNAAYVVYPNPVSSELTIEEVQTDGNALTAAANLDKEFDISLFDKNGEKLKTGKSRNGKLVLDVHDLPEDTYILHFSDGKETVKQQIVIQHK